MSVRKALVIAFKVLAVCLVVAASFILGGLLSGLNSIGQEASSGQHMADDFLLPFMTLSISVSVAVSYLILRSSWHGWRLVGAMCVSMYGISTVVTQIESVWFLSSKLPRGMIPALFVQGAIATALSVPLSVLL